VLMRQSLVRTLSRQARRHRATCGPGPGTPTLMTRGPLGIAVLLTEAPNSPSGSSSTASRSAIQTGDGSFLHSLPTLTDSPAFPESCWPSSLS
jgi:hypothetical protein